MSKKANLQKEIRSASKSNKPRKERECYVCGGNDEIQTHHIIKVAQIIGIMLFKPFLLTKDFYIPTVDMCNNDHHIMHDLMEDTHGNIKEPITENKAEKFREILDLVDNEEYFGTAYEEDYDRIMHNMRNTVEKNLEYYTEKEMNDYEL